MQFNLVGKELAMYTKWSEEHYPSCPYFNKSEGAIGGRETISFTLTSLGCLVTVFCACGAAADITDYENW